MADPAKFLPGGALVGPDAVEEACLMSRGIYFDEATHVEFTRVHVGFIVAVQTAIALGDLPEVSITVLLEAAAHQVARALAMRTPAHRDEALTYLVARSSVLADEYLTQKKEQS